MEIFLNSEDLSVALYEAAAEAEAVPVMGYHPQRRGEKCRLLKYRLSLVTSDGAQKSEPDFATRRGAPVGQLKVTASGSVRTPKTNLTMQ